MNLLSIRKLTTTYSCIPGTAGELAQGYVDGEHFLVTNPINLYSKVEVSTRSGNGTISVQPQYCSKARRAAELTLQLFGVRHVDVNINITSQIPIGKGMASSTADIVAVIKATSKAFGYTISPEQISSIATVIEPSDGLMYKGMVCYNHRQGKLLEQFGFVLMTQLVVDLSGSVDTLEFNRVPKNYTSAEVVAFVEILSLLRKGIKEGNLALIGQAATWSSQINQCYLFKPELNSILEVATDCGAFGVACAHSGTILSLIFSPDDTDGIQIAQRAISEKFDRNFNMMSLKSI